MFFNTRVGAREHFDRLQDVTDRVGIAEIDKDFIIRGLLTISDAPTNFDVAVVEKHWEAMEVKFPTFETSLRCAIDFCRSQDVRILSSSLLDPVGTLLPVVYYLSHQKNSSVPDSERFNLRALIYFLLFNRFLSGRNPAARVRYLRDVLKRQTRGQPSSRRTARSDRVPATETLSPASNKAVVFLRMRSPRFAHDDLMLATIGACVHLTRGASCSASLPFPRHAQPYNRRRSPVERNNEAAPLVIRQGRSDQPTRRQQRPPRQRSPVPDRTASGRHTV